MAVTPIPIVRHLVPDAPPRLEAEGFTRLRERLPAGLPHVVALGGDLRLVLVVPTGTAAAWRDSDPAATVTESASAGRAHDPAAPAAPGRPPARLILVEGGGVLASVPLVAGRRRMLPDTGRADAGVRIELVILGWELRAGSLRGAGDVGSWIELAWRTADRAADEFSPPRVSLDVLERQPEEKPVTEAPA